MHKDFGGFEKLFRPDTSVLRVCAGFIRTLKGLGSGFRERTGDLEFRGKCLGFPTTEGEL